MCYSVLWEANVFIALDRINQVLHHTEANTMKTTSKKEEELPANTTDYTGSGNVSLSSGSLKVKQEFPDFMQDLVIPESLQFKGDTVFPTPTSEMGDLHAERNESGMKQCAEKDRPNLKIKQEQHKKRNTLRLNSKGVKKQFSFKGEPRCGRCKITFSSQKEYLNHYREVHQVKRCTQCSKTRDGYQAPEVDSEKIVLRFGEKLTILVILCQFRAIRFMYSDRIEC